MSKRPSKPKSRRPSLPPSCSCILWCDDVVVSHGHDKHRLEGIIGAISVPLVPVNIQGGVIYLRLSNVRNNQSLKVALAPADDRREPLWEAEIEIPSQNDPHAVRTLVARVPSFRVSEIGVYMLEARYDGVPIAQTPILIKIGTTPGSLPPGPGSPPEEKP